MKQQNIRLFDENVDDQSDEYEDDEGEEGQLKRQPLFRQKRPNTASKNADLNPLSKLMSPLRDILPRNWFNNDKSEAELEAVLQPPRKPGSKNQPPQLFPPIFRNEKRKTGAVNLRLASQNFQGPSKQFPSALQQNKFGHVAEPPSRGGQFQHRGPSLRPQKSLRNQKTPFREYVKQQSDSFSERRILRSETLPEVRSSASTLTTPLAVDITDDDDAMVTSDSDENNDANVATRFEETTLKNLIQQLSGLLFQAPKLPIPIVLYSISMLV